VVLTLAGVVTEASVRNGERLSLPARELQTEQKRSSGEVRFLTFFLGSSPVIHLYP
jgi:hypothetical protein